MNWDEVDFNQLLQDDFYFNEILNALRTRDEITDLIDRLQVFYDFHPQTERRVAALRKFYNLRGHKGFRPEPPPTAKRQQQPQYRQPTAEEVSRIALLTSMFGDAAEARATVLGSPGTNIVHRLRSGPIPPTAERLISLPPLEYRPRRRPVPPRVPTPPAEPRHRAPRFFPPPPAKRRRLTPPPLPSDRAKRQLQTEPGDEEQGAPKQQKPYTSPPHTPAVYIEEEPALPEEEPLEEEEEEEPAFPALPQEEEPFDVRLPPDIWLGWMNEDDAFEELIKWLAALTPEERDAIYHRHVDWFINNKRRIVDEIYRRKQMLEREYDYGGLENAEQLAAIDQMLEEAHIEPGYQPPLFFGDLEPFVPGEPEAVPPPPSAPVEPTPFDPLLDRFPPRELADMLAAGDTNRLRQLMIALADLTEARLLRVLRRYDTRDLRFFYAVGEEYLRDLREKQATSSFNTAPVQAMVIRVMQAMGSVLGLQPLEDIEQEEEEEAQEEAEEVPVRQQRYPALEEVPELVQLYERYGSDALTEQEQAEFKSYIDALLDCIAGLEEEYDTIPEIINRLRRSGPVPRPPDTDRDRMNRLRFWIDENSALHPTFTDIPDSNFLREILQAVRDDTLPLLGSNRMVLLVRKFPGSSRADKSVPLRPDTIASLLRSLDVVPTEGGEEEPYDDMFDELPGEPPSSYVIKFFPTRGMGYPDQSRSGGFFPFTLKKQFKDTDLERCLRRYRIHCEVLPEYYEDNCLVHALTAAGVDAARIADVQVQCFGRDVPRRKLKKVAELIKRPIRVRYVTERAKNDAYKTAKTGDFLELAQVRNHYFLNETSTMRIDAVKKLRFPHHRIQRSSVKNCKSLKLVNFIIEHSDFFLDPIELTSELMKTHYCEENKLSIGELPEASEDNCRSVEVQAGHPNSWSKACQWFFDTETTTEGDKHKTYLMCAVNAAGQQVHSFGDSAKPILDSICAGRKSVVIMAHNARYDSETLVRELSQVHTLIEKGSRLKLLRGTYGNCKVTLKDTYSMISFPLSRFGNLFKLDVEKELMPYEMYTESAMRDPQLPLRQVEEYYMDRPGVYEEFLARLTRLDLLSQDMTYWDHQGYALYYCLRDCEVLMKGYLTFRDQVFTVCKELDVPLIDVYDIVSSSQLTFELAKRKKLLEGVYETSGLLRHVISQCVRGGKVMTRDNLKWKVEEPLTDLDANGLYASAMHSMGGFLLGRPKLITPDVDVLSIPRDRGTFFAEVRFHRIPKKLHFPLLHVECPKTKSHLYTNDEAAICAPGVTHWVDGVFLDDVIQYHGLQRDDFEIIRGYYYDEGRNDRVHDFMQFLKDKRDIAKREGNPIEGLYKLLGNSLYGRMLMKPVKTQRVFVPYKKLLKYLYVHYTAVLSFTHLTPTMVVVEESTTIVDHWALPHVGSEILSVSKHIMNVPMMIADDHDICNYYMDTDSMHICLKDVPRLAELFEHETGYPLIGDDFCQFKCDFELRDSQGKPCSNVQAKGTWILGKKCYLDLLEGTDANGARVEGFHPRIKGCSKAALYHRAAEMNPHLNLRDQVTAVYEAMLNGETISMDLLSKGEGAKLGFVSNKNFTTSTRESFNRRYSFPGPVYTAG